jgi:fructokinase
MLTQSRFGIDLGGTKIEAVCLDERGEIIARKRVPTPRAYDGTLDAIAGLVRDLEQETGRHGPIGIGIPGAVSPETGLVKNANSVWLIGKPLIRDLETRLGRPVRATNDANCFAISEAADGAGAGYGVVFGVIIGTGVGGGIVVDRRVLDGANLIAGEWGHMPLPWMRPDEYPGSRCYCGRDGCVETFLSGPGFQQDFERATGRRLIGTEIAAAAAAGDPPAAAALHRYHDRLARSLAVVIDILDPEVIVLGGGMSNVPQLAESVRALLPRYVFSDSVVTPIVRNRHGDSSGVRGAAWLWPAPTEQS